MYLFSLCHVLLRVGPFDEITHQIKDELDRKYITELSS